MCLGSPEEQVGQGVVKGAIRTEDCLLRSSMRLMPSLNQRSYTDRQLFLAGAVALTALLVAYWDVVVQLVTIWSTDDNYSHGFLIPPIAAYLAWERREQFRSAPAGRSVTGLVVVVGSLVMLAPGMPGFLSRLSLVSAIAGMVLLFFGPARLRTFALPLGVLLLMIPLPPPVFDRLELPLRMATSVLSEAFIRAADIPVIRDGNLLMLGNVTLEVARECSGIRTAISLVTLGLVFGYTADSRVALRLIVVALTIPVVVVVNSARVAGTALGTHYYGPAAAQGFFHDVAGWLAFAAAFGIMLLIHRLLVASVSDRAVASPPPANAPLQS